MAHVLILGGGFGGVVAAERLAKALDPEHRITLVSRSRRFVFYPALVRLAFGDCETEDVSFDLREAMLDRRVRFIEAEVAPFDPLAGSATLAGGEVTGDVPYDYLIFALGRRLATEKVPGLFEHSHHLLSVEAALKFGEAVRDFHEGQAVIGHCAGARLDVPAYEAAFALSRTLAERGERDRVKITLLHPQRFDERLEGFEMAQALRAALEAHGVEIVEEFSVSRVTATDVRDGVNVLPYDLLLLVPPFAGAGAATRSGITDGGGFIRVNRKMQVIKVPRTYAVGDAVNFRGPKMGHMAVLQAEVAAANVVAEIGGREPRDEYEHELRYVVSAGGPDSIYVHQRLWRGGQAEVRQGRFWSWAKRVHEAYWQRRHA